jgi:hypothetical protein
VINLAHAVRRKSYEVAPDLSGRLEAYLDRMSPAASQSWGAPFNGQDRRRELVEQVLDSCSVSAIVETGTYRGTTTEWFAQRTEVKVVSVEVHSRFYHYSRRRLAGFKNVKVVLGDSDHVLHALAHSADVPKERVLFYLDAHWYSTQPLANEFQTIAAHWVDWIVLIDDFMVPDDPGYGYDTHDDISLAVDKLGLDRLPNVHVFWPSARSIDETGMKRGCAILSHGLMTRRVGALTGLRRAPVM